MISRDKDHKKNRTYKKQNIIISVQWREQETQTYRIKKSVRMKNGYGRKHKLHTKNSCRILT